MYSNNFVIVDVLVGKILSSIEVIDDEKIVFITTEGEQFLMFHEQDCCEDVEIDDIIGNLNNLIGSEILVAEESSSDQVQDSLMKNDQHAESFTWTFYKFATIKGYVDIRWYGQSNGYYSEKSRFL